MALDGAEWSDIVSRDVDAFHIVIDQVIRSLTEYSEQEEARELLRKYEGACKKGTVAYLRFCGTASYMEWLLGNYGSAVTWGEEGVRFVEESHMDTNHTPIESLGLALRDAGHYDQALERFLFGKSVAEVISPSANAETLSASLYGNIGRCLLFKGELDMALKFLVRSAKLLEGSDSANNTLNRGYAALWIGELLSQQGKREVAYYFCRRAKVIWTKRAPLRVGQADDKLKVVSEGLSASALGKCDEEVEKLCSDWIGRVEL